MWWHKVLKGKLMTLTQTNSWASFGGEQRVYKHTAQSTGTDMTFSVYLPPQAKAGPVPVLLFLSGLTCNWENVTTKALPQRICAELGIAFVAPDTSPRGEDVPNDDAYDLGQGAGFYVNATQAPWSTHFNMERYISTELPALLIAELPELDMNRIGISGHSMGGHGALTLALRSPGAYLSVSAFSPIVAPSQCPWGEKAFTTYLGSDQDAWRSHDAVALIEDGARLADILIDQGSADSFLETQLKPELLHTACAKANIPLTLNMRDGYDHSYYFIATFIEDHLRYHAARLSKTV
jgi:S-formylglutathione hydrolase